MLRYTHLVFGAVLFVVFLITGQYMRADFPDKEAIPQELRLLMRSRHIYILFSALIHLALGLYLQMRPGKWRLVLQSAGSVILILSSIILLWAFVAETYEYRQFSDLSRTGIYTALLGIGLHVIGGLGGRKASG